MLYSVVLFIVQYWHWCDAFASFPPFFLALPKELAGGRSSCLLEQRQLFLGGSGPFRKRTTFWAACWVGRSERQKTHGRHACLEVGEINTGHVLLLEQKSHQKAYYLENISNDCFVCFSPKHQEDLGEEIISI